jgi:alkylation response protein AidB-like acyl-CoA dehydrogenase
MIKEMVSKFMVNEVMPKLANCEKYNKFEREIFEKFAELGLLGIMVPSEYNGANMDAVSFAIITEEVAKVSPSLAMVLLIQNISVLILTQLGKEYLQNFINGTQFATISIIEHSPISIEDLTISGVKRLVINADESDLFLIISNDTCFVIEKSNNISFEKEEMIGLSLANIGKISFNSCKIQHKLDLNKNIINLARIGIAAICVGIIQFSFDSSIKYSKERIQFGKPIISFDMVKEMLANMSIQLNAARALVYQSAYLYDNNKDCFNESLYARVFSTESAVNSTLNAIQIHGGYGYTKDYPVEKYFRDAKSLEIFFEPLHAERIKIIDVLNY